MGYKAWLPLVPQATLEMTRRREREGPTKPQNAGAALSPKNDVATLHLFGLVLAAIAAIHMIGVRLGLDLLGKKCLWRTQRQRIVDAQRNAMPKPTAFYVVCAASESIARGPW